MEGVRLQKLLSMAGVASRRAAEQLIVEGRVVVNGQVVMTLGSKADPAHDDVRVDGRRLRFDLRPRYIVLNKPKGYVTTRKDPEGRRTVMALDELRRGVFLDGRRTARATVRRGGTTGKGSKQLTKLTLGLHEGRNRQVRRMCA